MEQASLTICFSRSQKEAEVVELKEPEKEEDGNDEDEDGVAKGDDLTKEKGDLDDKEEGEERKGSSGHR